MSWKLFPTVSDCFNFSGRPVSPLDPWFSKNHDIQHFFLQPFCAQVVQNDAVWLWNPIYPQKIQNPKTLWNSIAISLFRFLFVLTGEFESVLRTSSPWSRWPKMLRPVSNVWRVESEQSVGVLWKVNAALCIFKYIHIFVQRTWIHINIPSID